LDVFLKEKNKIRHDREALLSVNRAISSRCSNLGYHYAQSGQLKKSFAIYHRGYRETRDPIMLMRAMSGFIPGQLKQFLKDTVSAN
jgi:hypothetical protein